MADKNVTIKLGGDATGLVGALKSAGRETEVLSSAFAQMARGSGIQLSGQLQRTVKDLEALRNHLISTKAPAADLEKVTAKLTEAQLKFKDSLKTDAMKQQEAALDSLRSKYTEQNSALSALGKTVTDNRAGFQALGGVMTAMGGAIIGSLAVSAKSAIDFESAFAGVRKTVNASEPELAKMRNQFLQMSTEIPVSAAALSKLGQVAGQLGVRSENVVGFARVIADLGISSNLAGEEGATMLAQFGNIVKLDQTKYSNLASALVDLGNNSATTEKDIAAMGLRLAGAGNAAGLSAPQILGLSASLASVGIEAEAGGTAFSQLLIKMQKATKEGGDSLKQFAGVSGVTSAQFKKAFEEDAAGALIKFLKGVDGLNKSGANTFAILEGMGIQGIRMTDAITRAANANDKFEGSIKRSSEAFDKNTALAKEASERYKTVESQLQILANTVTNLAIRIGEAVLPALRAFVDIAKPIISAISDWAKAQPGLTTGIVAFGGAIGGLMLTLGPLLFALPSMVEGFVLAKGAILAMGGVGGVATAAISGLTAAIALGATAFAAWQFGTWIAEITGLDEAFVDLGQSLIRLSETNQVANAAVNALTFGFLTGDNSAKLLQATTEKLNKTLDTPLIKQASESWADYADRVAKAAFAQTGIAGQLQQINAEALKLGSSLGVTLSGALKETAKQHSVLLAQLIQQKAPQADIERATLAANAAWDKYKSSLKDVNIELPKSGSALKDVGNATSNTGKSVRDAGKDFLSLASAAGAVIPKLIEQVKKNEEYVASLKKSKVEGKQLEEAERNLASAKKALTDATKDETARFLEWRDSVQKGREQLNLVIQSIQTYKGLNFGAGIGADISKIDTGVASLEKMGVALKPIGTAFGDAEAAMKTLGITSSAVLNVQVRETKAVYDAIIAKYGEASREGQLAWAAMSQAQIDATVQAGGKIDTETQRTVDLIKSKYGDLKNDKDANLSTWRELASKQVSTLVSDVSKGFADILTSGGNFGSKIVAMFKQIGQGMLQGFFESGIGGLLSGKGLQGFSGFATGLLDAFKGKGGGGFQIPGLGALGGAGTATTPPFLPAGITFGGGGKYSPGFGGMATGGPGMGVSALGGAAAGFGTGAGLAGALGVGQKGSTFAGLAGAAGGGISALLGAGAMAGPWGMAIGAAAAGIAALVGKFTRRGQEKETATGAADELSRVVWQEIVPSAQKGIITAEQADESIRNLWAQYEEFLRANLKDQVVIQRSIDGQKLTLTEGLAAVEALRGKEAETSAARSELDALIKTFIETGAITGALSEKIAELSGNLGPFKEAIKLPELTATRSQFAALRDELLKLKPPAEDVTASFIQTGQITEALRAKIEEFGGSASVFEQFSGIKTMRADFESLSASILTTGQGLDQIRPMFDQMGVSVSALDAAAALPGLQGLRGEFGSLLDQINQLLPATQSWQEQFLKTGIITDDMRKKIAEAGGDLEIFNKAAGEISAGGLSAGTASIVATELGKMTKGLDEQIADLQKGLTEALEEVGTKLDAQFEDSRTALIAQLDILDGSLTTSIGSLQAALQTEVSNLAAAISAIKIPSEITVNVEQPTVSAPPPPEAAPEPSYPSFTSSPYPPDNYGNQSATDWMQQQYGDTFGAGGGITASMGQEAVLPMPLANYMIHPQVVADFAQTESGRLNPYAPAPQSSSSGAPAAVTTAPNVEQTNNYYRVSEDEYTLRMMQERANQNFVDMLARGG